MDVASEPGHGGAQVVCTYSGDAPLAELGYRIRLRCDAAWQSRHVLQSRALAGARRVYERTLQGRSLARPGRVAGAHTHLAHALGALWPPAAGLAHTQTQLSLPRCPIWEYACDALG